MSKFTFILVSNIAILLASCSGAKYGHLTTRVKGHNIAENTKQLTTNNLDSDVKPSAKESAALNENIHPEVEIIPSADAIQPFEKTIPIIRKYKETKIAKPIISQSPENAIVLTDSTSIEQRKHYYARANRQTTIATIFLLVGWIMFFPLNLVVSLVLSAIAVNTYRKYANPGVPEKYTRALIVLIASALLLVLLGVGIYLVILFW